MNYNQIINYLAFVSDTDESKIEELKSLTSILKKHYSDIELSTYKKVLIERLKSKISESNVYLQSASMLGTSTMNYDFILLDQTYSRNLKVVIDFWNFAVSFFEDNTKQSQNIELTLNFDKLPDYIKPDQLSQLMGWSEATISTKHSRRELACVEGTRLTPKAGLKEYLEKRTKGLIENPDEWFNEEILKKQKKRKSVNK
jgi:site-specific recombinase XerD